MFAIMGMFPVGYYDLSVAGFPMHATAFRPRKREALDRNPFRVFTTLLRMELLTERTRELVVRALSQRKIFTERLVELIQRAEERGLLSKKECGEFIKEGLDTFRWHSRATVTLEEYQILKNEHPLVADIVSFPNCHVNHLTPRTIDIDLVQKLMQDRGMTAKERIESTAQLSDSPAPDELQGAGRDGVFPGCFVGYLCQGFSHCSLWGDRAARVCSDAEGSSVV